MHPVLHRIPHRVKDVPYVASDLHQHCIACTKYNASDRAPRGHTNQFRNSLHSLAFGAPPDVGPDMMPKAHVNYTKVAKYSSDMSDVSSNMASSGVLRKHVYCVISVCSHRTRPT